MSKITNENRQLISKETYFLRGALAILEWGLRSLPEEEGILFQEEVFQQLERRGWVIPESWVERKKEFGFAGGLTACELMAAQPEQARNQALHMSIIGDIVAICQDIIAAHQEILPNICKHLQPPEIMSAEKETPAAKAKFQKEIRKKERLVAKHGNKDRNGVLILPKITLRPIHAAQDLPYGSFDWAKQLLARETNSNSRSL